jgi:hypothetical protein
MKHVFLMVLPEGKEEREKTTQKHTHTNKT